MRQRLLSVLIAAALTVAVTGDYASADRQRYDGHKLIRVDLPEVEQLETFLRLVDGNTGTEPGQWDIWPDGEIRIGRLDVRVSPDQFQVVRASGLEFEVLFDDLQPYVDANYAGGAAAADEWYTAYHPLEGEPGSIFERMQMLADTYPDLAEIIEVGTTLENRPQRALLITGDGPGVDKPGFFMHSGIHAREWITPPMAMYTAEWLLTNYGSDPQATKLVDEIEWTILVVMNADGYAFTWSDNRMWRKNRRDNGDGTIGVDLNRNYGYGWGGPGSSGRTGDETYRGPEPFWEPESQNCRDYVLDHDNIAAFIDHHSYTQKLMWPWGHKGELSADEDEFRYVGENMQRLIKDVHGIEYEIGPVYHAIYPASGVTVDWVYGEQMDDQFILAYTTELRPKTSNPGFLLPPEEIIPTVEEILPATLFMAERILQPYLQVTVLSELPDFVEPDEPSSFEIQVVERRGEASGEASLFYRNAPGEFTEVAMTDMGEGRFEGDIPGLPCGDEVEYYFYTTADDGTPFTKPVGAPDELYTYDVAVITEILSDNFENNIGWTEQNLGATSGDWQRGVPVNDPDWDYDPISDSDGSGQCYLTQNEMGNTDVDDGAVQLTSPLLDMSAGNMLISYDYYLYLTRIEAADRILVEINSDGGVGQWFEIARHATHGGLDWRNHIITQDDLDAKGVRMTDEMVMRFIASDEGRASIVEAGIDAFKVRRIGCDAGEIECKDIKKLKAKCSKKGKLKVRVLLTSNDHHGQSVDIDINGTPMTLDVKGKKALVKISNQSGSKTVTLTKPAGCVEPKVATCPE